MTEPNERRQDTDVGNEPNLDEAELPERPVFLLTKSELKLLGIAGVRSSSIFHRLRLLTIMILLKRSGSSSTVWNSLPSVLVQ